MCREYSVCDVWHAAYLLVHHQCRDLAQGSEREVLKAAPLFAEISKDGTTRGTQKVQGGM